MQSFFFHTHEEGEPDHTHWWEMDWNPSAAWRSFLSLVGLALLPALLGVLGYRSIFFVDETEYAYVTQFGQPIRLHTTPGLQCKWPYQSLWRFDRRLQIYEPPGREMLTGDKENLTVEWYVCWRLPQQDGDAARGKDLEPLLRRFWQSVGTREFAEARLEERIQAVLAAEIGQTRLSQLVALPPQSVALSEIAQRVRDQVATDALDQFGLDVVDVRIKRFNYPEAVKPAVFAEIRSERERVAVQYRAEGASQKTQLESLATLQREQLLAQARREAARYRGEGEAKAMEIANAAHAKNPEFYEFLKTLETYRSALDDQTTLVISADSPFLQLLLRGRMRNGEAIPGIPLPATRKANAPKDTDPSANNSPLPQATEVGP